MPVAERYSWGAAALFWLGLLLGAGIDHFLFAR